MTSHAVLLLPGPEADPRVMTGLCGGLSLLDRLLRQLRRAGVTSALVIERSGCTLGSLAGTGGRVRRWWPDGIEIVAVPQGLGPLEVLRSIEHLLPARFLFLPANLLIDQRVLDRLLGQPPVTTLDWGGGPAGILDRTVLGQAGLSFGRRMQASAAGMYHHELRRSLAPFLLPVTSLGDLQRGSLLLLEHTQKGALDLPGQYFDTPFENFLVRLLAPTWITPNQVSIATMIGGFVIALMLWRGWLASAALFGLVIGILDGVDGKLARLRLETSRLGELEHIGDFFYENAWYLAVAAHLDLLAVGWGMVAADLADNMAYMVVRRRHGKLLDEMSPLDRAFRSVAGRRNIYVWIFVVGFCLAAPATTLRLAAGWAVLTAIVHWMRALRWLKSARPRVSPAELSSQSEPGFSVVPPGTGNR